MYQAVDGLLDQHFGTRVDRGGRLVEDQDRRVLEQSAGDGQPFEERDVKPADMRLDVSDSSTVETLVEELAHPDEERVLYAIDVLESLGKQNLVTPLLLHHSSTAVRARALAALGATRPAIAEQWVPVIQDMIKDENTDVRAGAIGALAHINNEDATILTNAGSEFP